MSEPLIKTPGVFGENGNFLLERELGAGGMGGVYMGRDKMLDRPVAVKVMLKEYGDDPEFVDKFKKEAQSTARLIHPNIAQVYSYGICDGMPYIAMELVAGGSLFSLMTANKGKTDVARVLKICQQVAQALQCASDQGFVHGDVKPENILLDATGNAKLVDFGLAAMQKDTTEIWGTPYYISPEKVKKEPVDFRSDMYSLGGTLYHALTGVAPFEGEDSIAVIKKRFIGPPRKPSEIRPDLTSAIDELVMKMLSLDKEGRYPSFEALLAAFRDVLTSGLTPTTAAKAAPSATTRIGTTGTRRMTGVRGRHVMMKRPGATAAVRRDVESVEDIENDEATGEKSRSRKSLRMTARRPSTVAEEDDEENGNIGAKAFGVVIGAIALVAAVIGGLVWYQVADKKARAAEEQAQISAGFAKARAAITEAVVAADKFADEFDGFAARAISECQKPTDELLKALPEEQGAMLKPGPTKELLDAIASTNVVAEAAATNAPAATGSATNAVAQQVMAPAAAPVMTMPKFREPTEEEKDPASPEGEKYAQERKAFMEAQLKKMIEQANKPAGGASESAPANAEPAATGGDSKKSSVIPPVVINMNDLWERAYGCQACAIRIRVAINKLKEKAAEADTVKTATLQSANFLSDLSRTVVEMFEQIKTSKDVEYVRKGITYIKSKGEKTVAQTLRQLKLEKLRAEREAKEKAAQEAEKRRLEELERARKAKVAEECKNARDKFNAIVAQGCFRQLDWKSALRMLTVFKEDLTTPQGQLATDLEIRKVNDMKMVHDIFIRNAKGHVFKSKQLRNCKIETLDEKEMILHKPGAQTKLKIPWQKFYRDYTRSLNEMFNIYIVNARMPSAKNRIASLLEWSNAMTGCALTMQLVCSETPRAIERSIELMKTVVTNFPEYEKTAKEIFPDMSFEETKEEEDE